MTQLNYKHNKSLIPFAKSLRKNMTKEERHLWYDFLRSHPVKFLRQKTIGKFIVDFYSAKLKLAIELDGSQHYDKIGIEKDTERTRFLEKYNITVVRIPNNQVNQNFEGVCDYINLFIEQSLSHF